MTSPISATGSYLSAIATVPATDYSGGFSTQATTFLGMHFTASEAKQLWQAVVSMISQQIQHENDKAVEALRKMRSGES